MAAHKWGPPHPQVKMQTLLIWFARAWIILASQLASLFILEPIVFLNWELGMGAIGCRILDNFQNSILAYNHRANLLIRTQKIFVVRMSSIIVSNWQEGEWLFCKGCTFLHNNNNKLLLGNVNL